MKDFFRFQFRSINECETERLCRRPSFPDVVMMATLSSFPDVFSVAKLGLEEDATNSHRGSQGLQCSRTKNGPPFLLFIVLYTLRYVPSRPFGSVIPSCQSHFVFQSNAKGFRSPSTSSSLLFPCFDSFRSAPWPDSKASIEIAQHFALSRLQTVDA